MKFISRFLNTIAGIFRIFVTLAFLWGIVFTFFVDRNLLTAFYDILGFDSVSPEIIKIITAIIFAFAFFVNLVVTRLIFKANKTGSHHMSNMFFGFVFVFIDLGIYFFTRDQNFLYLLIFSVVLIIGSLFGLGAKARGLYPSQDTSDKEEVSSQELLNEDTTNLEVEDSQDNQEKEEIDDEKLDKEDLEKVKNEETIEQIPDETKEEKEESLESDKEDLEKETSEANNEDDNGIETISEVANQKEHLSKEETYDKAFSQVSNDIEEVTIEKDNSTKTENKEENKE